MIFKLLQGGVGPQGAQGNIGRPGNMVKHNVYTKYMLVIKWLQVAYCKIPLESNLVYVYKSDKLCNTFEWYTIEYPTSYLYFLGIHTTFRHNFFIPCHRKYSGQHNQCDIRAAHDSEYVSDEE